MSNERNVKNVKKVKLVDVKEKNKAPLNVNRKVNIPVMRVNSMATAMMYSKYRDQPYDQITNDYFIVVGYNRKGRLVEMAVWYKNRMDYKNASLKIKEKIERKAEVNLYDDVLFNALQYDKEFVGYVEEHAGEVKMYVDTETLHNDGWIGNKAKEPIIPVNNRVKE